MNPGENLRGRPSNYSLRERNLLALVGQYNEVSPAQRIHKRLKYLQLVQYHLSPTAFERLLEHADSEEESNARILTSFYKIYFHFRSPPVTPSKLLQHRKKSEALKSLARSYHSLSTRTK